MTNLYSIPTVQAIWMQQNKQFLYVQIF